MLAGARLRGRGARVDALLVGTRAYQPGLDALADAGGAVVDCRTDTGHAAARAAIAAADLVVDGIVGTAGTTGLRPPAAKLVSAIPTAATVVAVDLPSGVDPDTGETYGPHVHADLTAALSAYTPCLLVPPAAHAAGTGKVQAWLLGSGVEDDTDQEAAVEKALDSGLPCVVDAGALETCVRRRANGHRPTPAGQVLLVLC